MTERRANATHSFATLLTHITSRFHADSDEDDDDEDDFGLGNVKAGTLDDDEDAQLNPLRTAYQSGWERAMEPEPRIKEEDDELMT